VLLTLLSRYWLPSVAAAFKVDEKESTVAALNFDAFGFGFQRSQLPQLHPHTVARRKLPAIMLGAAPPRRPSLRSAAARPQRYSRGPGPAMDSSLKPTAILKTSPPLRRGLDRRPELNS
jgi:hypothetical protein